MGIEPVIEPNLPDSKQHPDFLIPHLSGKLLLEVTIRDIELESQEMEQFSTSLQRDLGTISSNHVLVADISTPCPYVEWIPEIRARVELELQKSNIGKTEFTWAKHH